MKYALVLAVLLLASCGSSDDSIQNGTAKYCPEDGGWCGTEACPVDSDGNCRRCGKPPVTVDAKMLSWIWCTEHNSWHDSNCDLNTQELCCARQPAVAMVVGGDVKGSKGDYSPHCGGFCGPACPKDSKGNCKACGKPPVQAEFVDRTWNWCGHHKEWHDAPCGDNASKNCCKEYKARILITR